MRERMVFLKDDRVPEYERELTLLERDGWSARAEVKLPDPNQALLYLEREVYSRNRQASPGRRRSDAGPRHRL